MAEEYVAQWPIREEGPEHALPSGLLAGVSSADITPPHGIPNMNWGSGIHIESTGNDPLGMRVTALVLSDGSNQFAIVDIDRGDVDGVESAVERASEKAGIPVGQIRIAASHTHAGPAVTSVKGPVGADLETYEAMLGRYRDMVIDKIVGTIVNAKSMLRPVHMYGERGTGSININRRFRESVLGPAAVGLNPDEFVDRDLVVFRIDESDGDPYVIIANFQAHGTVLGYANTLVSPDWMGATRQTIEQSIPGVTAMFLQGAAGNMGPVEGYTGDLSVAYRLGRMLGHEAVAVALGIETVQRAPQFEGYVESTARQARQHWRVSGPRDQTLKQASKLIQVPSRQISDQAMQALLEQRRIAEQLVVNYDNSDESVPALQARARLRRLVNLADLWQTLRGQSEPREIRIDALRIGDLAIVSIPGEPFAEIGAAIKSASPFAVTMISAYSTGEGGGYMPIEDEYRHGGYEVEITPYGEGAAEEVIRAASEMLSALHASP